MKIQFTQNGKVVAERKAFVAAEIVDCGADGRLPGVDFDREEFPIGDRPLDCWVLMETAYTSMNEGEEYSRESLGMNDDLGYRLVTDDGTTVTRADVEKAFQSEL